jgi:hypothetical protein
MYATCAGAARGPDAAVFQPWGVCPGGMNHVASTRPYGRNDILRPGSDPDAIAERFEAAVADLKGAVGTVLVCTGFDTRGVPVLRHLRGKIAAARRAGARPRCPRRPGPGVAPGVAAGALRGAQGQHPVGQGASGAVDRAAAARGVLGRRHHAEAARSAAAVGRRAGERGLPVKPVKWPSGVGVPVTGRVVRGQFGPHHAPRSILPGNRSPGQREHAHQEQPAPAFRLHARVARRGFL